jgi:hypothetical protein
MTRTTVNSDLRDRSPTSAAVAEEIRRVVRNQLEYCEAAIKERNESRALEELDDAIRRLRRIADQLHSDDV